MSGPKKMQTNEQRHLNDARADSDISLVRGGPFYRAQEAIRLIKRDRWNLGRRVIFAIAVGWFLLVLITLLFNPRAVLGLVTDYPIKARMLVGVPVLLVGQLVMENVFRTIFRHIHDAALLTPSDADRLNQPLVKLVRLRDSIIPELVIAAEAYARVAQTTQIHYPWGLNLGAGALREARPLVQRSRHGRTAFGILPENRIQLCCICCIRSRKIHLG